MEVVREGAVTGKTHDDQARAFRRWKEYCDSIDLMDDYYLNYFTRGQQVKLVGIVVVTIHGEQFSGPTYDTLVECTLRRAGAYVSSPSRESDRQNPTRDENGKLGQLLSQ